MLYAFAIRNSKIDYSRHSSHLQALFSSFATHFLQVSFYSIFLQHHFYRLFSHRSFSHRLFSHRPFSHRSLFSQAPFLTGPFLTGPFLTGAFSHRSFSHRRLFSQVLFSQAPYEIGFSVRSCRGWASSPVRSDFLPLFCTRHIVNNPDLTIRCTAQVFLIRLYEVQGKRSRLLYMGQDQGHLSVRGEYPFHCRRKDTVSRFHIHGRAAES